MRASRLTFTTSSRQGVRVGLFDMDMRNPEAQGFNSALMQAAAALLTPRHRGGGMGAAFAAFPQAIEQSKALAQRNRMLGLQEQQMGLQTAEAQRKAQAQAAQHQNLMRLIAGLPPEQQAAAMVAPEKFAEAQLPQAPKLETIFGPDGQPQKAWVRGPGADPVPVGGSQRPAMPWEYELGPDGQPRMRPGVLGAKTQVAQAGKPSVSVKVDNKMGESLGAQVGPMLKDSATATSGAVKMADSAQRIIASVDSGNVFAGPGASWVLRGAQVADVLGVGGKSNAEKISNTRQVIRGLAEASLEARKELQGQGQVTENEAAAVQKAMSGNIDELTTAEIRLIAGLNIKAAKLRVRQHQEKLRAIPESMGNVAPFYTVPGADAVLQIPDSTDAPASPAAAPAAGSRVRYDAQSGRLVPVK